MAKVLKEDLILQFLESKKATCLLPLIEMVGNLDELVEKGPAQFAAEIPKVIDFCHKKLSDNDHIFEDIWETGTDEEIVRIGRERGQIREKRRIKKNEGVFLSRENVPALVNSLILLLTEARNHVTESEEKVYFMKCREDIIPASANKIKMYVNKEVTTSEDIVEEVEETVSVDVVEEKIVEDEIKPTETEVVEEKVEYREVSSDMIRHTPKDSMIIKEYIEDYRNKIMLDKSFDINNLIDKWEDKFNTFDGNFKKEHIMKAYHEFYSNPNNPLEKVVGDFAVWKHILPKNLLATNYFSK